VVARVGAPGPEHLAYTASLLAAVPSEWTQAVRDPMGAQAVVIALLLDTQNPAVREQQSQLLSAQSAPAVGREALRLGALAGRLDPAVRLPVADMALATLRYLSRSQYAEFRRLIFQLTTADNRIGLLEYVVLRMMIRNLDPLFGLAKRPSVKHTAFAPVTPQCVVLLSALAWSGNEDPAAAAAAFGQGLSELGIGAEQRLTSKDACALEKMDVALDALVATAPPLKQRLLSACVACVSADGRVTIAEAELLRAVADALECPIPPFLPT
jgi:hypothetical protein